MLLTQGLTSSSHPFNTRPATCLSGLRHHCIHCRLQPIAPLPMGLFRNPHGHTSRGVSDWPVFFRAWVVLGRVAPTVLNCTFAESLRAPRNHGLNNDAKHGGGRERERERERREAGRRGEGLTHRYSLTHTHTRAHTHAQTHTRTHTHTHKTKQFDIEAG